MATQASQFAGSVPEHYQRSMVPVVFEPYAAEMATRLPTTAKDVLEVACGTGVLTRRLLRALPSDGRLVATDLNEAMLVVARTQVEQDSRLEWRMADGAALPFDDHSFDAVVCQFGVMFLPDKSQGMKEARRVLRPGGVYLFDVWDTFATNPFGRIAHYTIASFFESDAPAFYLTPFGFADDQVIRGMLTEAGFREIAIERVKKDTVSPTAREFANGLVRGNPVSAMIEERGADPLKFIEAIERELVAEGGEVPYRSTMQALVVTATA